MGGGGRSLRGKYGWRDIRWVGGQAGRGLLVGSVPHLIAAKFSELCQCLLRDVLGEEACANAIAALHQGVLRKADGTLRLGLELPFGDNQSWEGSRGRVG